MTLKMQLVKLKNHTAALCDWAVSCATDRDIDAATLTADCLTAVEAFDPTCADYASLNMADSTTLIYVHPVLTTAKREGECGFFVASFEEVTSLSLDDLLPADCLVQDPTFDTFTERAMPLSRPTQNSVLDLVLAFVKPWLDVHLQNKWTQPLSNSDSPVSTIIALVLHPFKALSLHVSQVVSLHQKIL